MFGEAALELAEGPPPCLLRATVDRLRRLPCDCANGRRALTFAILKASAATRSGFATWFSRPRPEFVRRERSGGLLLQLTAGCGQSLQIKRLEIDRVDKERRMRSAPHGVRDDLSGERERSSRALDHDHRLNLYEAENSPPGTRPRS